MDAIEKKTLITKVTGIGEIKIEMSLLGNNIWLKEIEKFITKSDEKFYAISNIRTELKTPIHLQRALQTFINHLQAGGEEQKLSLIQSHFRNWINKQNGSLKYIISDNGQPNTSESKQEFRKNVSEIFNNRYQ